MQKKTSHSILQIEKIHFNYHNEILFKGLKNISFQLNEAETLVLVGKSGSGKTTLLKCIYGLHDLQSGSITFDKEPVLGPAFHLILGNVHMKLVSTGYALLEHHTVYENIADVLIGFHDEYKAKKASELLRLIEMTTLRDKKINTLSDGQRQRVALAKAICVFPKLLLLDEPFSNLDIILKEKIFTYIKKKLKQHKSSCIIVTHRLDEVLSSANYLGVIKNGKLCQLDTYKNIKKNPADDYVKNLVNYQ